MSTAELVPLSTHPAAALPAFGTPEVVNAGVPIVVRRAPTAEASRVASDLRVQACHRQYPGGTLELVAS